MADCVSEQAKVLCDTVAALLQVRGLELHGYIYIYIKLYIYILVCVCMHPEAEI